MAFFDDIIDGVGALRDLVGDVAEGAELPDAIDALEDAAVVRLLESATDAAKALEQVRLVSSGVVARRSRRDAGHAGLSQSRGHRTPITLIQELTGTTRAEAAKHVRVGEALCATETDAADPEVAGSPGSSEDPGFSETPESDAAASTPPWHASLSGALFARTITSQQHDAIRRGLGEPPADEDGRTRADDHDAWSVAAEELVREAADAPLEELAAAARALRDHLDPEGAAARFAARYESRSFRMWKDADGIQHGSFVFEDEGAAWIRSIIDSALRPRRGGPRFVDSAAKTRAQELSDDPRTNDQLTYDLLLDVLGAGSVAEAETVFGTRQPGLRLVQIIDGGTDPHGSASFVGAAHLEDDGSRLPASLAAKQGCTAGTRLCTTDREGNPLRLGRTQRLFSSAQRIALAIRDGGCRWKGCERPASYCEAHHIDEWNRDDGRTDVERGILLCRFHHMQLHHGGWRITREGMGDFLLHPPGSARPGGPPPIPLRRRLALRYAWQDAAPPPRRFAPAA